MARTKRKDRLDHVSRRPRGFVFMNEFIDTSPTEKEIREAHQDGKKSRKPGRKAKVYLHKGHKAKAKMAVKTAKDFDELVVPVPKKSDVWLCN